MRRSKRAQRGTVSVEFALLLPLFLVLVVGAVHFGRVIKTRHQLTDATNYATRAAAVAGVTNAGQIRALLEERMGGATTDCTNITVNAATEVDAVGLVRLEVSATCELAIGFGATILGAVGPDDLTVRAAFPM